MAHMLYCRKLKNKQVVSKLAGIRTKALRMENPDAKGVKGMDVVDDAIERYVSHPDIQKELNEQS